MLRGKLFTRDLRRRNIGQRMSYITNLNTVLPVKLLLKREDHDHLANIFFDLLDPSGAPGPDLRAHEIEDRNAEPMQFASKAQVEVREVDEHGGIRLASRCLRHKMFEALPNSW